MAGEVDDAAEELARRRPSTPPRPPGDRSARPARGCPGLPWPGWVIVKPSFIRNRRLNATLSSLPKPTPHSRRRALASASHDRLDDRLLDLRQVLGIGADRLVVDQRPHQRRGVVELAGQVVSDRSSRMRVRGADQDRLGLGCRVFFSIAERTDLTVCPRMKSASMPTIATRVLPSSNTAARALQGS